MNQEEARKVLEKAGYYTETLWSTRDVQSLFECTDEQAMEVLRGTFNGEYVNQEIWFAIKLIGEFNNLKRKTDDSSNED